jgi:hypothetical protein
MNDYSTTFYMTKIKSESINQKPRQKNRIYSAGSKHEIMNHVTLDSHRMLYKIFQLEKFIILAGTINLA